VTAEKGARIAGGKRFANALAGHSALRVSIADVCEEKVREVVSLRRVLQYRELPSDVPVAANVRPWQLWSNTSSRDVRFEFLSRL
jgi:hypothetical protein